MNAKQMLLDYAASNNTGGRLTNEQFIGQAIAEGIRIYRNSESIIVRVKRSGQIITLTETIKDERWDVGAGKMVTTETTSEIFQVNV